MRQILAGSRPTWFFVVLAAAALLCAPAPADDEGAAAEESGVTGVVIDEFDIEVRVTNLAFFEPEGGFLSTGKGKRLKELRLWNGAHQILVDPAEIAAVAVHEDAPAELEPDSESETDADLIWVTVELRSGDRQKGKVERTLELRGEVALGRYVIQVDRVKRVVFDAAEHDRDQR